MFHSLFPVEKPVLGRGLNSLIAGGAGSSDRRATDLLSSFQAKRTRVAPGLRSLLQGAQSTAPKPAPAPHPQVPVTTPAPRPPAPTPVPDASARLGTLRVSRPPRPRPAPAMPNYRPTRTARPVAAAPEQKKNQDPTSAGSVHSSVEPAFQRPVVRKRPTYLKAQPAPQPPPQSVVSPGFRLSLFVVDWFLLFVGFAVVWYSAPPIGWLTLTLCSFAIILGAALGTWSFMLEPKLTDEDAAAEAK